MRTAPCIFGMESVRLHTVDDSVSVSVSVSSVGLSLLPAITIAFALALALAAMASNHRVADLGCHLVAALVHHRVADWGCHLVPALEYLGSRLGSRMGSRLGSRIGSRMGSRLGSRLGLSRQLLRDSRKETLSRLSGLRLLVAQRTGLRGHEVHTHFTIDHNEGNVVVLRERVSLFPEVHLHCEAVLGQKGTLRENAVRRAVDCNGKPVHGLRPVRVQATGRNHVVNTAELNRDVLVDLRSLRLPWLPESRTCRTCRLASFGRRTIMTCKRRELVIVSRNRLGRQSRHSCRTLVPKWQRYLQPTCILSFFFFYLKKIIINFFSLKYISYYQYL